jgi:hypothetical protein
MRPLSRSRLHASSWRRHGMENEAERNGATASPALRDIPFGTRPSCIYLGASSLMHPGSNTRSSDATSPVLPTVDNFTSPASRPYLTTSSCRAAPTSANQLTGDSSSPNLSADSHPLTPQWSGSSTTSSITNSRHLEPYYVNSMFASMYAEEYSYSLFIWCHHCITYAEARELYIFDIKKANVDLLRTMFASPTASFDRSSITRGLWLMKTYMDILAKATRLRAVPVQVPGLLRFCEHVYYENDSLPPSELEDWDAVIKLHTGKDISQIVRAPRYRILGR